MSHELDKPSQGEQPLTVELEVQPSNTPIDGQVTLRATPTIDKVEDFTYDFSIQTNPPGGIVYPDVTAGTAGNIARWVAEVATPRSCLARVEIKRKHPTGRDERDKAYKEDWITVTQELPTSDDIDKLSVDVNALPDRIPVPPVLQGPTVPVTLSRSQSQATSDQLFWEIIRDRTDAISFPRYRVFIDTVMCSGNLPSGGVNDTRAPYESRFESRLPFPGVAAYNLLKAATEYFLMQECGVISSDPARPGSIVDADELRAFRNSYLTALRQEDPRVLPYFDLIRQRLGELELKPAGALGPDCYGILRSRVTEPCMIELIWSYWHEEGMQSQAMNAISYRFQNKRSAPGSRDPLTHLDLDPLRGLNNLLWGFIQDEQHRLSVVRRAYEYDHHYGLRLYGKAVSNFNPVDSRSKFLEAFHNLLYRASLFYKEDDDTTIIADGFEILNALREVHLLLAHGAHNQFGDLPSNARQEMLIEQWLLARPEMREFLGGKIMVPYSEPWMDRVDTIKSLFGWTDTSATYFNDLAEHGEQILLSVRYGNWSQVNDMASAANWARYWRPEIQRYVHAYRAVTGVDLTVEMVDAGRSDERYIQPSVHLRHRLAQQRSGAALPPGDRRALGPAADPVSGVTGRPLALRDRNR